MFPAHPHLRVVAPAGQAATATPPPTTATAPAAPPIAVAPDGRITGIDGMLDQIAAAVVGQARVQLLPALQQDKALQDRLGEAIGRGAAREAAPALWIAAGALAVLAVAAVAVATRPRPERRTRGV
jgi:hypothetical protein